MRGLHQCLVAEIHYQLDPVPSGATPGSSDNLAQRNILFDFSDNPGSFAAHLVHHTFELEPSPISFAQSVLAPDRVASATAARLHPDELIIDWGGLPRDSLVTFYMPQVDAREIVRASAVRQAPANLTAVGADTIRCKVSDVGFTPIPGPLDRTIAGLMTVQLPPGVPYGKVYRVVLRPVSGRGYRVLGTTEFRIEVSRADQLLPRFRHNLAVLKHIAQSIPTDNRWYPVFERYLAELGDRFRAFGGDPESVAPNPHGTGTRPGDDGRPDEGKTFCVTGQVAKLHYRCCGEFEGFPLIDCDEVWEFDCVKPCFEPVLLTAARNRMRATVHAREGRAIDLAINRSCPWSGRPIRADALTRYRGDTVGFCSPAHRDRFAAAIAMFENRVDREPVSPTPRPTPPRPNPQEPGPNTPPHGAHDEQAARPVPPTPAARPMQPPVQPSSAAKPDVPNTGALNERCPWSGKPVKANALATYRGAVVGFCNSHHRDEFEAAVKVFDARISCPDRCDRSRPIVERIDLHS